MNTQTASSLTIAGLNTSMAKGCIFCKIVNGDEKAWKIYEDEFCLAFLDVFPVTEGHVLIITKEHVVDVFDLGEKAFMDLFKVSRKISMVMKKGLDAEFVNIITAPGVIKHAFIHIVPRYSHDLMGPVPDMENKRKMDDDNMKKLSDKLRRVLDVKGKA